MKKFGTPEPGELVICQIAKIHPNSVTVNLIEYDAAGLIHVSEVASRWVRDIREFVKEGQFVVCRVLRVEDRTISRSIKRVHRDQASRKLTEFKRERKVEKMLEIAAKSIGKTLEEAYQEIGNRLYEEFGSLSKTFEMAVKNEQLLRDKKIPPKWIEAIVAIARTKIGEKTYKISADLTLLSYAPDGVKIITQILSQARQNNAWLEVKYIAAPHYLLTGQGKSYKQLETQLTQVGESMVKEIKKAGGEGSFAVKE